MECRRMRFFLIPSDESIMSDIGELHFTDRPNVEHSASCRATICLAALLHCWAAQVADRRDSLLLSAVQNVHNSFTWANRLCLNS